MALLSVVKRYPQRTQLLAPGDTTAPQRKHKGLEEARAIGVTLVPQALQNVQPS
jgi:hypothetical protein